MTSIPLTASTTSFFITCSAVTASGQCRELTRTEEEDGSGAERFRPSRVGGGGWERV